MEVPEVSAERPSHYHTLPYCSLTYASFVLLSPPPPFPLSPSFLSHFFSSCPSGSSSSSSPSRFYVKLQEQQESDPFPRAKAHPDCCIQTAWLPMRLALHICLSLCDLKAIVFSQKNIQGASSPIGWNILDEREIPPSAVNVPRSSLGSHGIPDASVTQKTLIRLENL